MADSVDDSAENPLDVAFCADVSSLNSMSSQDCTNAAIIDSTIPLPLPLPFDENHLPLAVFARDEITVFANPLIPILLPAPSANENLPLAVLAFGLNVPILAEHAPRLLDPVVNLSGLLLTTHQLDLLSKGLSFRVTPKLLPHLKLMAGVESAVADLRRQNVDLADSVRNLVNR